jgi:glycosyltransferase involved in cell wall biosynthesis
MQLVICSKSAWRPSIRREHAIACSAAADGHEVVFIERPADVRALRTASGRREWIRGLRSRAQPEGGGVSVVAQSTLVPGHRSRSAETLDALRLRRTLSSVSGIGESVVVGTLPWHWPAIAAAPAARRVFDGADDWRALIPARGEAFAGLYARIAREADAVLVASEELRDAFPGGAVTVVANGVDRALTAAPARPPAAPPRLVYAGTLSERVDASLLGDVLERLAGWELGLYGECQYAERGRRPGAELEALLRRHGARVRLHGAIERSGLAEVLDRASVLVAPYRVGLTAGQSSMKLFDYAARGRPIVATPGALGPAALTAPAGVREAAGAEAFAEAVLAAASHDGQAAAASARASWLETHAWDARWEQWRRIAFGEARA